MNFSDIFGIRLHIFLVNQMDSCLGFAAICVLSRGTQYGFWLVMVGIDILMDWNIIINGTKSN